jgi:6-phosphogluconolactonase
MRRASLLCLALAVACSSSSKNDAGTAGGDAAAGGSGGSAGSAGGAGGRAGSGGSAGQAGGASGAAGGAGGASRDGGSDAMAAGGAGGAGGSAAASNPFVYISGADPQIRTFQLDLNSGALAMKGMSPAGGNSPTYMAFRPDKKFAYALNEGSPGRIMSYSINQTTGDLTMINMALSGGNGPAHLSVHKSGKWVLSSNYGSGHVATLAIMDSGAVADPVMDNILQPVMQHAHQIINDVSGKFVFVPSPEPMNGSTMGKIMQLVIDVNTGKLTMNDPPSAPTAPDARPRHVAFHPNEKWAYHVNETGATVVAWNYDAATGKLSNPDTQPATPAGYMGPAANGAHLVVHPTGKYLYVAVRVLNAIVMYTIDQNTGRLSNPVFEMGGGMIKTPRDFNVDPSGRYLIVANQDGGTVMVFRINAADGKLTQVGDPIAVKSPQFVGFLNLP